MAVKVGTHQRERFVFQPVLYGVLGLFDLLKRVFGRAVPLKFEEKNVVGQVDNGVDPPFICAYFYIDVVMPTLM